MRCKDAINAFGIEHIVNAFGHHGLIFCRDFQSAIQCCLTINS